MATRYRDENEDEARLEGVRRPGPGLVSDRSLARGGDAEERLVHTVSEAAALLGISRAFAYELVARGELPVIRLGRRRLVPRRALLALVELEPIGEDSGG